MTSTTPPTPGGSHRGSPLYLLQKLLTGRRGGAEASSEPVHAGRQSNLHLGASTFHAAGALLVVVALAIGGAASGGAGPAVQALYSIVEIRDSQPSLGQVPLQEVPVPTATVPQATPRISDAAVQPRPWLGIYARDVVFPDDFPSALACQGAMIVHVVPDGPAEMAGLLGASLKLPRDNAAIAQPGDVIVAVDRLGVTSVGDLTYDLDLLGKPVGATVKLRIVRMTRVLEVSVKLGARDDANPEAL